MKVKSKMISVGIVFLLVLSGFLFIPTMSNDIVEAKTLHVGGTGSNNYTKIQTAIDAAGVGDTVYVHAGIYKENIYINKTITLIGADKANTTIDGKGTGHVIQIKADWVNVTGFKLTNSGTNHLDAGVAIISASNCSIWDNNVSSNGGSGFSILTSCYNNIKNNFITNNKEYGITVRYTSTHNNIINNVIKNNCNNKNPNVAGLTLVYHSSYNVISGNKINYNHLHGMIFYSSCDYNLVKLNSISANNNGITFILTDIGNIFYLNEFINNTKHINSTTTSRTWNSIVKITYMYNNTNFTNFMGNYWDDYTGKDNNGDGIGESPYLINTEKDSYPLVKPLEYYTIISTITKMNLTAVKTKVTTEKVSITIANANLNASVSGDLLGSINFTDLQFVTIDSGSSAGKGFFKSNWTSTLENLPYHGTWQGMLFKKSSDKKIYLKGTFFGDLEGKSEGFLTETTKNSGTYDLLNSGAVLYKVGKDIVFVNLTIKGTVNYQKILKTSSEIYKLQSLFTGTAKGYYNKSISVVLTHIRINNATHKYYGEGFSIITYISAWGSGSGWTYDRLISPKIVNLTGFFTEPLWGIVFGKLDENPINKTLSITIIRFDIGLPPAPIIHMKVWGPWRASPGDTFNYFIEYRNIGLKTINNVEILLLLPKNTTYYNSSTGKGIYNSTNHSVTWRLNIPAKSKGLISVKCKVKWGLSWGIKLNCSCYFREYYEKIPIAFASWCIDILPAVDPNVKHGPDGFVIPGEKLTYTIEFENEGLGTAYDVYFTDTLSEYLNDCTLEIGSVYSKKDNTVIAQPGIYDRGSRTIT
ncbi:MAG: right-handed parallel beta-helix repeat-containing protein, partial [Thermoplasmata archaeon]